MNYPRSLSAQFKEDFAYPTVKDRLPVILTKAVDTIHRMKAGVIEKYGEKAVEELKQIAGSLSKLKYELQTGKPLSPLSDDMPDVNVWNQYLEEDRQIQNGREPSWFVSSWLYTECYFYRRIREAIRLSDKLKDLDPFENQKQNALITAMDACRALAVFLQESTSDLSERSPKIKELFSEFMLISLWGNKCDLSISAGVENTQKIDPVSSLKSLQPFLLRNDMFKIWHHLSEGPGKQQDKRQIDIILDNAGFELFTDLCLADFLIESKIATSVRLHGKAMPWFVSDVTINDLQWTLEHLKESDHTILSHYGSKWKKNLESGVWKYSANTYWTGPEDYSLMQERCPVLYSDLSTSTLLIFKGDLNYRKLTGDLKWDFETPFHTALRGFNPAPLCALRTLKCDLAVGITDEKAQNAKDQDEEWMLNGRWGVVQFDTK